MSVMIHSCMVFFVNIVVVYLIILLGYSLTWLNSNFKLHLLSHSSQLKLFFISLSLVRYFEFTLFIYNSTIAVYLLKAYEQILSSVSVALSFLCTFTNSQLL